MAKWSAIKIELCKEYGISRKSGYKWLERYASGGMAGLEERSRAPKRITSRTVEAVKRIIVSEKRLHPTWRPMKIQRILTTKHGMKRAPVVSTVGEVLKRHGMVEERRRRGGVFRVERGELTEAKRCTEVLGVDFRETEIWVKGSRNL